MRRYLTVADGAGGRDYECSDCSRTFTGKGLRTAHAMNTGHMSDRTCLKCAKTFYTPHGLSLHKILHKAHALDSAVTDDTSDLGPVPSPETTKRHLAIGRVDHGETDVPSRSSLTAMSDPTLNHTSPHYWRDQDPLEAPLHRRPKHGYTWASPALSEAICPYITFELLDKDRLHSEGFPTTNSLPTNQYEQGNIHPYQPSHVTPSNLPVPSANLSTGRKKYAALVIDCEMVELKDHVSDLVRISVVDFLTGDIVLNNLVQPVDTVKYWRARVSGVNPSILRAAHRDPNTTVLQGWPEARQKIFALADSDTVLMGHALSNDLKILRIAADRVVDSLVLTAAAAFGRTTKRFQRKWSLKSACKELMNIDIQMSKHAGHDPLEDALATRELILWCLTHPADLLAWGDNARTKYEKAAKERLEKQKAAAIEKAEAKKRLEAAMVEVDIKEELDEAAPSIMIFSPVLARDRNIW